MLSYVLTEPATVHVEIYTPGTTFGHLQMTSYSNIAVDPTPNNGYLVASYTEQKAGRVSVNTKWDGRCWYEGATVGPDRGCYQYGVAVGTALPDGDYVYLIWAEIPYSSPYSPGTQTIVINGITWDGVKTHMIYNGILPINRGLVDIVVEPVGYATLGSSPSAYGLDPFTMRYSLARDAVVSTRIITSPGTLSGGGTGFYEVKRMTESEVKVAQQMNVETWDGKDDTGRSVSQGQYMYEVVARDGLFPDKVTTGSVIFPVDMYRVLDVESSGITGLTPGSTGVLQENAQISYILSKAMDVTVSIYDRNVVIPTLTEQNAYEGCPEVCTTAQCVGPPQGTDCPDTCIHYQDGSIRVNGVTTPPAPIRTYNGPRPGEGIVVTEQWDGYNFTTGLANVYPDGLYPYMICARADTAGAAYYTARDTTLPITAANSYTGIMEAIDGKDATAVYALGESAQFNPRVTPPSWMHASDKPTGHIAIARGPVEFFEKEVKPSNPQMYYTSETIQIPVYEIGFMTSRTAQVTVQVISTEPGMCMGGAAMGTVCRTITQTSASIGCKTGGGMPLILPQYPVQCSGIYDGGVKNKITWDGKDDNGEYVGRSAYEIRFIGEIYPYPAPRPDGTAESLVVNVNNFQLFDRQIWDVTPQNGGQGKFGYQVSVPMKVGIQIFKPGTTIADLSTGTLTDPACPSCAAVDELNVRNVLVKAIVGVRPHLLSIEDAWDGTDYAGQQVPDGAYPFRYVTVVDGYDMDSVDGHIKSGSLNTADTVAVWDKFVNLEIINVANGDSWYSDLDWKSEKVTMFYPNPLRGGRGQFEITKLPAPGTVTIKIYNIAGDLVREGGYECYNARGESHSLEVWNAGGLQPDMGSGTAGLVGGVNRNFALRCEWDKTNEHGKKVARGLYYAIMELNPTQGSGKKSQRVIKILIP
jgi:flagellar hook assembly protein FlgD